MLVLGIETSCDETGAAVVMNGQRVLSDVVATQLQQHEAYGGVVPELAARAHITAIVPVIERALADAGVARADLDAIAVTAGPGLAGSLLAGMNVAKSFAYALDRPLVPVNHLEAHIYANWLGAPGEAPPKPPAFPLVCLLVSGGHSELVLMRGHGQYALLGQTLDDAAGEAFDKGARLLGLGYPGGPAIQRAAENGDPTAFALPRAWLGESDDFSFSGLKTALLRAVDPWRLPPEPEPAVDPAAPVPAFREHRPPRFRDDAPVADLAASFQEAIVEPLVVKTIRAAERHGARAVLLAGGVAANRLLRTRLETAVREQLGTDTEFRSPPMRYCTDNAAMIAGAAAFAMRRGAQAGWEATIDPRLPLVASAS